MRKVILPILATAPKLEIPKYRKGTKYITERIMWNIIVERAKDKYPELKLYYGLIKNKRQTIGDVIVYCRIVGKTPTQLLSLGKDKANSKEEGLSLLDRFLLMIRDWKTNHNNEKCPIPLGMARKMRRSIRGFYKNNGLRLGENSVSLGTAPLKPKLEFLEREDVRKLRIVVSEYFDSTWKGIPPKWREQKRRQGEYQKEKFLLLIHFSSTIHLRRAEHLTVLWKEFKPNLDTPYPYLSFSGERLKGTPQSQLRFIGIVCETLREELLKWRDRQQKLFKEKGLKWNDSVPVFNLYNKPTKATSPSQVTHNFVRFARVWQKKYPKAKKKPIHIHAFRDYFENQLVMAELQYNIPLNPLVFGWLTEHVRGAKIDATYTNPDAQINAIISAFKRVEPLVDIDCKREPFKFPDAEEIIAMVEELKRLRVLLKEKGIE